jgi:AbrB family looped-hinge helix DNA binding protein
MSKLTNLTVKGQVTIPKDVRDALGLKPNEPVEIDWQGGDEAVIRKPKRNREAEIEAIKAQILATSQRFAHLREGRPTDEIMKDIRGDDPFPP